MKAIIITDEQRDEIARCIQYRITKIRAKLRWQERHELAGGGVEPNPNAQRIYDAREQRIERLQQLLAMIDPRDNLALINETEINL